MGNRGARIRCEEIRGEMKRATAVNMGMARCKQLDAAISRRYSLIIGKECPTTWRVEIYIPRNPQSRRQLLVLGDARNNLDEFNEKLNARLRECPMSHDYELPALAVCLDGHRLYSVTGVVGNIYLLCAVAVNSQLGESTAPVTVAQNAPVFVMTDGEHNAQAFLLMGSEEDEGKSGSRRQGEGIGFHLVPPPQISRCYMPNERVYVLDQCPERPAYRDYRMVTEAEATASISFAEEMRAVSHQQRAKLTHWQVDDLPFGSASSSSSSPSGWDNTHLEIHRKHAVTEDDEEVIYSGEIITEDRISQGVAK